MLNKTLVSVFTLVFLSIASQAIAGTTGWFNYSDSKIRAEKINKAKKSLAAGSSYTRVRCKVKDGNILMKVDYSYVFSDGWYGLIYGPTKSVEKTLATYKNQGARVRSRSDIDTKGGPFTCLTCHRGT